MCAQASMIRQCCESVGILYNWLYVLFSLPRVSRKSEGYSRIGKSLLPVHILSLDN